MVAEGDGGGALRGNTFSPSLGICPFYRYISEWLGRASSELDCIRGISLGWAAYGKHKNILESELPICLKKKIEQIIIPIMTYGSETWSLTASQENKLQVAQRSMGRKILGVTWQDRKSNAWIRERTKINLNS